MLDESRLLFARSNLGFYGNLSEAERAMIDRSIAHMSFSKGSTVRTNSSECLGLLLVHTGELRVFIQSEDGREVTLYRLGPGELCVFSATCVLNTITFDVSIEASQDTEVLKIHIAAFNEIMRQNVWVENFAYKSAIERFSDIMWAIEQVLFMRFDKRLAIFLLDESAKAENGELRLTHDEIARNVGSAREVVSRMLKSFESERLVELGRGVIRVLDRSGLKKFL